MADTSQQHTGGSPSSWWARGLLFENCSCQLVCPGHVHFDQLCTHDRCRGYWAMRFDAGDFGGASLEGVRAVVVFESPQRMIDGGWIEGIFIDDQASAAQYAAVETILTGRAGGPWSVLGRFVERRLPTARARIEMSDEGTTKRLSIAGRLTAVVTDIRGRDRSQPVRFENIYNQIHSPSQVLARGTTSYDDREIAFSTDGTHGLHSWFDWRVEAEP